MARSAWALLVAFGMAASASAAEPPLPRDVIAAGLSDPDCTLSFEEATADLEPPEDLGDGQQLVEIPCWHAAYQSGSIFFAFDPVAPERARLLQFRHPKGRGFEQRRSVSMATYDAEKKRLTSLHKGRGLGDCGSAGAWVWSGSEFTLESYWLKVDCNGKRFDPDGEPKKWRIIPRGR